MHRTLDSLKSHAHWLLRVSLAGVFLYHGVVKVMDLGAFSQMMGLSTGVAVLVALAEIAGGVGIIVGAFTNDLITRLAGLSIAPVMLGAIVMVHWGRWKSAVPAISPRATEPPKKRFIFFSSCCKVQAYILNYSDT